MRKKVIEELEIVLNANVRMLKEDHWSKESKARMNGDIIALKRIITRLEQIDETARQLRNFKQT